MASSSSSSSYNWVYDVFPSFSGGDVRQRFLSHFLTLLDRKLIITFKDNKIERSHSLDPELKQAIRTSRIAVVVFSKNYASSSWCLNELLEIVKCRKEIGQIVIPVFYDLDPSHVRKQTGEFGNIFQNTCKSKTKEEILMWQQALTDVANTLGYHSEKWPNEAKMIEEIASYVSGKLNLSTPSNDFEEFVGMEDHIAKMSELLYLDSKKARMVGIWGASGIGKTTIARALYGRLSPRFPGSVYIDRFFISKSTENCSRGCSGDYNMKLHLQRNFLSEILGEKDIKIDHLGVVRNRLKNQKVLIVVDDLGDQVVLDALVDECQWFGGGSRIIVVTNDKHLLAAHEINHIYEVPLPSEELALEMLCQSAFRQNSPPEGFKELAVEVIEYAGSLPLALNVLGSHLRGRNEKHWKEMLLRLQNSLDDKIEKALRVSYDVLSKQDQTIFRYIACLFNNTKISEIKLLLAKSKLGVDIGLENLVEKALIHVRSDYVEMHRLLQELGRKIVRAQSDKPGKREFLIDSADICDVLNENTGTQKVLGISLNVDEIDELHVHENAFKGMSKLCFLRIYSLQKENVWDLRKSPALGKEGILQLPESFDFLPKSLVSLRWDEYPMRCMPVKFRPQSLVELKMQNSKLEKLWEGVLSLKYLKRLDLSASEQLEELPDLSMATNLETLHLDGCSSLVALTSSIRNLHNLIDLTMSGCTNLEALPTGMNLKSLYRLNLNGCSRLRSFPDISTNISNLYLDGTSIEEFPSERLENLLVLSMEEIKSGKLWEGVQPLTPLTSWLGPSLTKLYLSHIPNLVELPSAIQNIPKLEQLVITKCINLETLPTNINLEFLDWLDLSGCSRLKSFPSFCTNITYLDLSESGFEEVLSCWMEKITRLEYLYMRNCNKLEYVRLNTPRPKYTDIDFSHCGALSRADINGFQALEFSNCFKLDQEPLIQQQSVIEELHLSGEKVPSYFTHRGTGTSSPAIPIHLTQTPGSTKFITFRVCAACVSHWTAKFQSLSISVKVNWRFKGNQVYSDCLKRYVKYPKEGSHLVIADRRFSIPHMNYDHVDVQLEMSCDVPSLREFKGWGIRLVDECLETEHGEESGDNNVETETSMKRKRRMERQRFRFSPLVAWRRRERFRRRVMWMVLQYYMEKQFRNLWI